jgi:hypothetical protein
MTCQQTSYYYYYYTPIQATVGLGASQQRFYDSLPTRPTDQSLLHNHTFVDIDAFAANLHPKGKLRPTQDAVVIATESLHIASLRL